MDQIRPVLTASADVAPGESDHLVIVEGLIVEGVAGCTRQTA